MIAWKSLTSGQSRDTGLAMTLIALIVCLVTSDTSWALAALVILLLSMTVPVLFRPAALLWWNLSFVLSIVVSKILLSAVFFVIVTPIALLRRIMGSDPFGKKRWKGAESALTVRDHVFTEADLRNPF